LFARCHDNTWRGLLSAFREIPMAITQSLRVGYEDERKEKDSDDTYAMVFFILFIFSSFLKMCH
jgi:hypothetical protein